jgi:hypothetical protein
VWSGAYLATELSDIGIRSEMAHDARQPIGRNLAVIICESDDLTASLCDGHIASGRQTGGRGSDISELTPRGID